MPITNKNQMRRPAAAAVAVIPEIIENISSTSSTMGVMQSSNTLREGQLPHPELERDVNFVEGIPTNEKDSDINNESDQQSYKRKRYTKLQIQKMEEFFKECPNPDNKQRQKLGHEIGLEASRIKIWFQNKRNQMKVKYEHSINIQLQAENEKYRAENTRILEALSKGVRCQKCGGKTISLRDMPFNNIILRKESPISMAAQSMLEYGSGSQGTNLESIGAGSSVLGDSYGRILEKPKDSDKEIITKLALFAMEELTILTKCAKEFWVESIDRTTLLLNDECYALAFTQKGQQGLGPKQPGYKTEASIETVILNVTQMTIIETMMNVNQWASVFSCIVSRASVIDVIWPGVDGSFSGKLQLMSAEFQVPSPLVPTRDSYFARYCEDLGNRLWAIVDISLDSIFRPNLPVHYRRRASGCLIQEMTHGCSQVTWVEHGEVNNVGVHNIYEDLVNGGLAFGAKRWVYTLERQCTRLASVKEINSSPTMGFGDQEGREKLLKLAEKLVLGFFGVVSASTPYPWTNVSGNWANEISVMRKSSNAEMVFNAATSFQYPAPPNIIFDLFRDHTRRQEWDLLVARVNVELISHIVNGRDPSNCVSLFRVNSEHRSESNLLILQETFTDPTASYVVYAPIEVPYMEFLFDGGSPDSIPVFPNGIAILPDKPTGLVGENNELVTGSLVTVSMQTLTSGPDSVGTILSVLNDTINRIKSSL